MGEHQARNALTAVAAAQVLAERGFPRLDRDAIRRGARACRWPGRVETVVLEGGPTVVLDAAHNPNGVASLVTVLAELDRPYDLLFGALAAKAIPEMLPPLAARARRVVLTTPPNSRAAEPEALTAHVPAAVEAVPVPDPEQALAEALRAEPKLLVVAGSLYLTGIVREDLRRRFGAPPPASAPLYVAAQAAASGG